MALTDKLSAIGEAIRYKTGKTTKLTLDQMPAEIRAIVTGSGGGSGGDYDIVVQENDDGTQSLFITDASGSEVVAPVLITKNITANGTYDAMLEGADGYASVTVNIPSQIPTLIDLTANSNGTYSPSTYNADGFSNVVVSVSGSGSSYWDEETVKAYIQDRSSITSVTLPDGLIQLGPYAFKDCTNLRTISNIPTNLKYVWQHALDGCNSLYLTSLPDTIEELGHHAFYGCNNLNISYLPPLLTGIPDYAFFGCGITPLTLPDVFSIGAYAFAYCGALTVLTLPSTLDMVDEGAFNDCLNLKTITFTSTPTGLGETIFANCTNLTTINVPWSEDAFINVNAPWGAPNATINYNYQG